MMERHDFLAGWMMLVCLIGWAAGCQKPQDVGPHRGGGAARDATQPVVTLKLLVVDDPELAAGIRRLRGEWNERTGGGRLQVLEWKLSELVAAHGLATDLVIYPSRYLGTLVQNSWLRPLRESVLRAPQFAWADLLPAIRDREITYGGDAYALPYGSPPLMLCYNAQVLQAAGCEVPQSWTDYRQTVSRLKRQGIPCQLPLANKSAAIIFLSRAISYAHRGGHMALLFDIDTFQPRITEPPFVRALKEIILEVGRDSETGQRGTAPASSPLLGFREAVREVTVGRSAMTLGWPGIDCAPPMGSAGDSTLVSYALLPRAKDIFSATRNQWETNRLETPRILLGVAGRLASVTAASRNAASAFKLLQWLGSGDTATEISVDSHYTLWYRRSQVRFAQRWLSRCHGKETSGQSVATGHPGATGLRQHNIGQTVASALANDECFLLPRIPGIDQYLESLGSAVRSAIAGATATTALQRAADQWDQVTGRLGREKQQLAYQAHLGL